MRRSCPACCQPKGFLQQRSHVVCIQCNVYLPHMCSCEGAAWSFLVNLVTTVLSDQVSQSLRLQIIELSIQTGASLTQQLTKVRNRSPEYNTAKSC
jgi:hypothetical protein